MMHNNPQGIHRIRINVLMFVDCLKIWMVYELNLDKNLCKALISTCFILIGNSCSPICAKFLILW